jgi:hypothetical protein
MPGADAKRGDIYNVHPDATLQGDAHPTPRPMVCVAELPTNGYIWRAMSRTTSVGNGEDLISPADTSLGLTEDGWWTYRYLRSVKKRWTGDPTWCAFKATLTEPLLSAVMAHYMSRNNP